MRSSLDNKSLSHIILFAMLCGLLAMVLASNHLLERWNYDLKNTLFTKPSSQDIVVIAIDDNSLQKLGRWPWSRAVHAQLINQLTEIKVRSIGFDVLFLEADTHHPENDLQLAEALKKNGAVVLPTLLEEDAQQQLYVTPPLANFSQAATQLSATKISFDQHGIVNGFYLESTIEQDRYPSLALAILSADSQTHFFFKNDHSLSFIPFSDALQDFQQLSYVDVLEKPELYPHLANKFIIVGITATGLGQRFATPVTHNAQLTSGVELTVKALASLLNNTVIQEMDIYWVMLLNFSGVFLALMSYGFVSSRQSLMILLGFVAINLLLSLILLKTTLIWYNPLNSGLILILSYPLWSNYRQEQIAKALSFEKEKTEATLQAIGDGIIATNTQGLVTFINPIAEMIIGRTAKQVLGKYFSDITQLKSPQELIPINQALIAGKILKSKLPHYLISQNQQEYAIRFSVNPINHNQITTGMVIALIDVSEILDINQQMTHLATHDALTGLPNRILLRDELLKAIEKANRHHQLAVLFIDLDGFKKINDGLGHAVGDELLIEISQRLIHSKRQIDTVARWGGDEFIVLITEINDEQQIHEIAQRIIKNVGEAVIINEQELFVTPSIGVSCFPKDATTVDALLATADVAMYKVKETGRNNYYFYHQNLNTEAKQRLVIEQEMHHALMEQHFEMFYQLQVDLATQKIVGVEALIRWRHPKKGILSPNYFIPLAEEVGLIIPIGEWIMEEVCQQLKLWQHLDIPPLYGAINLSVRQFMEKNLVSQLLKTLKDQQLDSQFIHIEITESLMITDIERVKTILEQLKSIGVSIAIDDFGTGYSSLTFLKRFAIDILKIDRSFVHNIFNNNDDHSIVKAVISLAHSMNMALVAEGIETQQQAELLTQLGCHTGQGYYYSQPLTAAAMTELLQQSQGVFQAV